MISTSVSGKNWILKKFSDTDIEKISNQNSVSQILAKLISIRKNKIKDVNAFLRPTIKNFLPNPLRLKDMKSAVDRTFSAIKNNEEIGIFGDYDVDGATSTALLSRYFLIIKKKTQIYIPDRKKEGYGPSITALENLVKKECKIIFTVDCGTLSFDPIKKIKEKNVDIIVLDHHQSEINLPTAYAIINPNRYDDTSELNYLCAAGVCFMFLVALNKKLRDENWFQVQNIKEPDMLDFLDLVSLGTVCDVVPLVDLNRAIVSQGLKVIKKRLNLGLKTLSDICKIDSFPNTYDLGYKLGPRINAGGRVGKSSHGAELLISDNPQRTYEIALDLEKFNNERKSIEFLLYNEINSKIQRHSNSPILVLDGENWHEGVMGIIASRLKDKYNKPSILISTDNELGKGSARSIVGFDIGSQIIKAVQIGLLIKGGGHKMAGGFTIKKENIYNFKDFLINNFNKFYIDKLETKNLYIDSIIAPSALNEEFFNEINLLAPFGPGNTEPKFVIQNLKIIKSEIVGENHIKSILLGNDGSTFKTMAWNVKNTALESFLTKNIKNKINIAGKMKENIWKGEKKIEFIIEDIALN